MAALGAYELEQRGDNESSQEDMFLNGNAPTGGVLVDIPYRRLMLVGLGSPVFGYGYTLFCSFQNSAGSKLLLANRAPAS